jgi:rare lipoprotein A
MRIERSYKMLLIVAVALVSTFIIYLLAKDDRGRAQNENAAQVGIASYYKTFKGMTAAHRTIPKGSKVKVTNLSNGREVELKIIGKGPMRRDRIIDVSEAAARELGIVKKGITKVRVEVLD